MPGKLSKEAAHTTGQQSEGIALIGDQSKPEQASRECLAKANAIRFRLVASGRWCNKLSSLMLSIIYKRLRIFVP